MKIKDAIFRVIDTETTGFGHEEGDRIVEFAYVDVRGDERRIDNSGSTLVNPGREIPPTASAIHHLTNRDVEGAPRWEMVRSHFLDQTARGPGKNRDRIINVAHNAEFDAVFCGEDPATWLCTYRLAAHLWPDAPGHGNQVLRYWLGLQVPEADGMLAHRAQADAFVTAHILIHLLDAVDSECDEGAGPGEMGVGSLIRLAQSPIIQSKVRFGKHRNEQWADVPSSYLSWMQKQGAEAWDRDTWATVMQQIQLRKGGRTDG